MKKTIQLLLAVQFVAASLFAQGTAGLAIGGSRGEQFYHVSALGEGGYLLVGSTDSEDAAESVPVQHSRWQTTSEAPSRVDRDFGARVTYLQGSPALDPFYIEDIFIPTKKIAFSAIAIGSLLEFGTRKAGGRVLSAAELLRIENAATRINKPITVVGSRASGKAGAYSDWDYVIEGGLNSKEWSKIKNSLPGARSILDNTPRNIDILPGPVWPGTPHITVHPR